MPTIGGARLPGSLARTCKAPIRAVKSAIPVGVLLKLVECYKMGSNASVVKPANLQEWLKS